ncbi:S41 family peptidase [Parashewanella spongiae]|uniref:S41 family peptidase n=1 Tax=Parashewanella spongiae TaxID=342950 RepID=UPI001FD19F8A|nr:S41 family peptidase [Parashewanella spongiae]
MASDLEWKQGTFQDQSLFKDFCANPRSGSFPDKNGSELHEKLWLRSWSNDTYLWFDEIVDNNPNTFSLVDYFEQLKTNEQTPSGANKDNFHFSMSTEEWEQRNQSGASLGYGARFEVINATPPRKVVVAYIEPNSPASEASIRRGDVIQTVNGVDVINSNSESDIAIINSALFPISDDNNYSFEFARPNLGIVFGVTMTPSVVVSSPVHNTKVIDTETGKVGYFQFNRHIATAEKELFDSMSYLNEKNVTDLIVDLRYNGGGLLALASQLAYMVAGSNSQTSTFELLNFNDKHPTINPITGQTIQPIPFYNVGLDFSLAPNTLLPSLDLQRVFVLTTDSTCSASEAFMNGLKGIDVEVIQIGGKTCGKPYGFYPAPNCGTTYFTIQFQGVNNKGFGDYSEGFSPNSNPITGDQLHGCSVLDDFSHQLGDNNEALLKAALQYRNNQTCPQPNNTSKLALSRNKELSGKAIQDRPILKFESIMQNKVLISH